MSAQYYVADKILDPVYVSRDFLWFTQIKAIVEEDPWIYFDSSLTTEYRAAVPITAKTFCNHGPKESRGSGERFSKTLACESRMGLKRRALGFLMTNGGTEVWDMSARQPFNIWPKQQPGQGW